VSEVSRPSRPTPADIAALAVCSLIWGTTWRAIKLQLGTVPPLESVVYRFALASALLLGWCLLSGRSLALTRRQHLEVMAQGFCGFCLQYAFVYLAEETVSSGAMAVIFASVAFANLVLFRLLLGRRAARLAWVATLLGLLGVAAMSFSEITSGRGGGAGIGFALGGVAAAVFGNLFAARAQAAGVALGPGTGWAMAYGTVLLGAWLLVSGARWEFEPSVRYVGALAYLAVLGSVVAFLTYYGLARRQGYTFASYVAALTPPTAMAISTFAEGTRWGLAAAGGLLLVVAGQALLIRSASRAKAAA
jgi:drug/metabolite transporter (DMT)-like permease